MIPTAAELRLAVLAVSVLHDVDVTPTEGGVGLPGGPVVLVTWDECRHALFGRDASSPAGRDALARWLLARRWAADAAGTLRERLRPVGLPVNHLLHPGLDWVCERLLGGELDLGLGAVGLDPDDPDAVVLLPPAALQDAGIAPEVVWPAARGYLEAMGALAADRLGRDAKGQLRPVGDCDAVTLLGARTLRTAMAGASGLAAAVVPMRRRGWTRLALIDPAFGPAAAAATDPADRGFLRPLLITADEVTVVPAGGRAAVAALGNAAFTPWPRDVLYR